MRLLIFIAAALLTAGCGDSITPKISTDLKTTRGNGGLITLSLTVKNETDRPTVPLVVVVEADGKPVIHPAAFALNRNEAHTVTGTLDTKAAVTAQLTIKEAERGKMVTTLSKEIPAVP